MHEMLMFLAVSRMKNDDHALFECTCGNSITRPRGMDGHPQCLTCYEMEFVKDVPAPDND